MRKIVIKRKKQFWGSALIIQVLVDNKLFATLRNGEEISIRDEAEQSHTIQCCYEGPGDFGGTKRMISDIIRIPSGNKNYELLVKQRMMSISLEMIHHAYFVFFLILRFF